MAENSKVDVAGTPSDHLSPADLAMWIDVDVQSDSDVAAFLEALDSDRSIEPALPSRRSLMAQVNHLRECSRCAQLTSQNTLHQPLTAAISNSLQAVPHDLVSKDRAIAAALAEFDSIHPAAARESEKPARAPRTRRRFGFFGRAPGLDSSSVSTQRTPTNGSGARTLLRPSVALSAALALTAAVGVFLVSQRGNNLVSGAVDTAANTEAVVEVAPVPVDDDSAQPDAEVAATEAAAAETSAAAILEKAPLEPSVEPAAPARTPPKGKEDAELAVAGATQAAASGDGNGLGDALRSEIAKDSAAGEPTEARTSSSNRTTRKQSQVLSSSAEGAKSSPVSKLPAIVPTTSAGAAAAGAAAASPTTTVAAPPNAIATSDEVEDLGSLGTFATIEDALAALKAVDLAAKTTSTTTVDSGFAKLSSVSPCVPKSGIRRFGRLVVGGRDAIALFAGPGAPVIIVDAETCTTF